MAYTINLNHEKKLVIYRHPGEVGKVEIGKAWMEFMSMKEFTEKNYNLFSDYRNSQFNLYLEDIDPVVNHLFQLKEILVNKKQALILDKPFSTALSMIFEEKVKEKIGFNVKIFSTEEAAYEWLDQ